MILIINTQDKTVSLPNNEYSELYSMEEVMEEFNKLVNSDFINYDIA